MDIHSYRNVHDKNPYTKKWIVIRTEMCMTKTHTRIIWIVICTNICMTKPIQKHILIWTFKVKNCTSQKQILHSRNTKAEIDTDNNIEYDVTSYQVK